MSITRLCVKGSVGCLLKDGEVLGGANKAAALNPARSNDTIQSPSHYVQGRTIEPICLIEEYGLCHHLACAVKYISRAGRKSSYANDLLKAIWYLQRELSLHQKGKKRCLPVCSEEPSFTVNEIVEDWGLSAYLGTSLSYILEAQQLKKISTTNPKKRDEVASFIEGSLIKAITFLECALESYEKDESHQGKYDAGKSI